MPAFLRCSLLWCSRMWNGEAPATDTTVRMSSSPPHERMRLNANAIWPDAFSGTTKAGRILRKETPFRWCACHRLQPGSTHHARGGRSGQHRPATHQLQSNPSGLAPMGAANRACSPRHGECPIHKNAQCHCPGAPATQARPRRTQSQKETPQELPDTDQTKESLQGMPPPKRLQKEGLS